MVAPTRPPANGFVKAMRRVYNPLGFSKGYNAILFLIFDGALLGFTLARLQYFNYSGVFCNPSVVGATGAAPGECYQYSLATYRRVGIQMHLFGILLASLFAVLQFVPIIRHKAILVHRIMGYMAIILALVGTVGALMITSFAFGGNVETQASIVFLSIIFLAALGMAIYNVKALQIEQHRAWMLRAWFYAGSIITQRIVMIIAVQIISLPSVGPYYKPLLCDQIFSLNTRNPDLVLTRYPVCSDRSAYALVPAKFATSPETTAAGLQLVFGMGIWVALALHAIGVEIYLKLTPAEAERLRKVSYQKQLERGFKHPGSAGLTVDRFGDSEKWKPPVPAMQRAASDDSAATLKHDSDATGTKQSSFV